MRHPLAMYGRLGRCAACRVLTLPPLQCHSATLFQVGDYEQVLVFGGFSRNKALADTWLLLPGESPSDWTWSEVKEQEGAPVARYGHSLDLVRDKLIMFGGSTGTEYLSDLFLLEVDDEVCIWRPISTQVFFCFVCVCLFAALTGCFLGTFGACVSCIRLH